MKRTLIFGTIHMLIAFSVAMIFTGSFVVAGAVTFVEPLVNMVAHYVFDRYWPPAAQPHTNALQTVTSDLSRTHGTGGEQAA